MMALAFVYKHAVVAMLIQLLPLIHVHAFWILDPTTLVQERLDPIVSPGEVSNHVHNIAGASNFGPNSTHDSLQSSNCTSIPVQVDKSAYWAPQLYYQNSSGLTLIPLAFLNLYYEQRGGPADPNAQNITAFPKGLRMLAGNVTRTTYNASNVEDMAVNFVCLDYSGTSGTSNEFPTNQCPDGLRAQIIFPSCWDGKNTDSDDHQSHVSYPEGNAPDNGNCPASHPVKMITMFHEWVFDVAKFDFQSGEKNWVFAFGDETGLGFHADFLNGWDVDILQQAIDQCTGDLFQNTEGCAPFAPHIDRDAAKACTIERIVDEEVDGPLSHLPGCQTIPFASIVGSCSSTATMNTNGIAPDATGSAGASGSGSGSGSVGTDAGATTSASDSEMGSTATSTSGSDSGTSTAGATLTASEYGTTGASSMSTTAPSASSTA